MGMSTHVKGFIPDTDPEYQKHKEILLFCHRIEVSLPSETANYFGIQFPQLYVLEEKLELALEKGVHFENWREDGSGGFEVDLTKLPKGITKLRFYNSW